MICLCLSFHACSQTDRRRHIVLWWYCCCSQMSSCQGCHFFFPAFFGFQSIILRDLGRISQFRHTPYLHSEETLLPLQLNRLRSAGLLTSARIRTSCSWHSEWNCQGVGRCFPFNPSDSQGNHLSTKEILDHPLIYMVQEMVSSSSDAQLCCAHWDNQNKNPSFHTVCCSCCIWRIKWLHHSCYSSTQYLGCQTYTHGWIWIELNVIISLSGHQLQTILNILVKQLNYVLPQHIVPVIPHISKQILLHKF